MNFTINIDKIGDISMQNLILIGVFAIFFFNAVANVIKIKHEINKEKTR